MKSVLSTSLALAVAILAGNGLLQNPGTAGQQPASGSPQTAPSPGANPAMQIPPEASSKRNPVKPTPESLARGKKAYGYDCAICHGEDGTGHGELVDSMKLTLKNYRDPAALEDLTDGDIFYIIQNGKGVMQGEADRRKPNEIWDIVNYVRSFSKPASHPAKRAGVAPKS